MPKSAKSLNNQNTMEWPDKFAYTPPDENNSYYRVVVASPKTRTRWVFWASAVPDDSDLHWVIAEAMDWIKSNDFAARIVNIGRVG